MTKILCALFLLTLSSACIKTADQVQREKRIESMNEQMQDSQGLVADVVSQMKDIHAQLDKLNGRIEELEHKQKQINPAAQKNMEETVNLVKTQQEIQTTQLAQIQTDIKEQRAFIEKVMASLGAMGKKTDGGKDKKKSVKEGLNQAQELIKNNKYSAARSELEPLLNWPDITPGDHNKVLHALGKVEFQTKNYEKAMVYFSKVFTKYPKASLAPSCLLFIGRSLEKLGKKDAANEAFAKVKEDYPGTKEAAEAKKEL